MFSDSSSDEEEITSKSSVDKTEQTTPVRKTPAAEVSLVRTGLARRHSAPPGRRSQEVTSTEQITPDVNRAKSAAKIIR